MIDFNRIRLFLTRFKYSKYFKAKQNMSKFKYINEYGAIFFHIPKAAGTSIYLSLFGSLGASHLRAVEFQRIYGYSKFNAYYKFTFVRNPYDRVVSAYTFLKNGGMNSMDKEFYEKYLKNFENFDDFVMNGLNVNPIIQRAVHFVPQYEFLMINGKINVNFIGKFENISQDYKFIANNLGLNTELSNLNSSKRANSYRDFYLNEKSKNIIENIYKKDLELFDYKF